MKGVSFQNGVEFKVSIEGETWSQGDLIQGTLQASVKNPGSTLPSLKLCLAEGTERRIKAKSPEAFRIIEELSSNTSSLEWKFTLPKDVRVSDKAGSLYILYGSATDTHALASLKLNIIPHLHIRELCEVLSIHSRFVLKFINAGKNNWVEVKFGPPDGKDWLFLEHLIVSLRIDDTKLYANFEFTRNAIDAMKGTLKTNIVKRELEREWSLANLIHDFNQRLNKDAAADAIDAVLAEYKSAGWLAS